MNAIKCFFEDGRTTIVIENPSVETNNSLKKMFEKNMEEITTLLAPTEDKVVEPETEPMTMGIRKDPAVETKDVSPLTSALTLLNNASKQKEIGIDKTILIFAEALDSPMDKVNRWLKDASMEQKKARYVDLRDLLKSMNNTEPEK